MTILGRKVRLDISWFALVFVDLVLLCLMAALVYGVGHPIAASALTRDSHPPKTPGQTPKASQSPAAVATEEERAQQAHFQEQLDKAMADVKAEIKQYDEDKRAILDKLITLVGAYTLFFGLTALVTVQAVRQNAKDQLDANKDDFKKFKEDAEAQLEATKEDFERSKQDDKDQFEANKKGFEKFILDSKSQYEASQKGLEEFKNSTAKMAKEFQEQLWSELPELKNLKASLRELLYELEELIPDEKDGSGDTLYDDLSEVERQRIWISEATINALPIFISQKSIDSRKTLAKIYSSLARIYFSRSWVEQDAVWAQRANVYLEKSIELNEKQARAYRIRGIQHLTTYNSLPDRTTDAAERCLRDAEIDLKKALAVNPGKLGTCYNFALLMNFRKKFREAFDISKQAIDSIEDDTSFEVEKFGSSLFGNAACYLAIMADQSQVEPEKKLLREEAIELLEQGKTILQKKKLGQTYMDLRAFIARECGESGDLQNFDDDQKHRLGEI